MATAVPFLCVHATERKMTSGLSVVTATRRDSACSRSVLRCPSPYHHDWRAVDYFHWILTGKNKKRDHGREVKASHSASITASARIGGASTVIYSDIELGRLGMTGLPGEALRVDDGSVVL
ncbi:hypothetical protein SRHO_G00072540 [Serrasalmus rhombeus]